jgi:ERCC4-type nuclease
LSEVDFCKNIFFFGIFILSEVDFCKNIFFFGIFIFFIKIFSSSGFLFFVFLKKEYKILFGSSIMIVADDRETNGANPYFEACISKNNNLFAKSPKIEYSISRVTTGDYHIIYKDKIHISFERKTWKDLAASIKDRRIDSQHRQMESLSNDSGTRIIYIIEGNKKGQGGKIGQIAITTLETKIRRIVLHGSQVEMSKSQHETAEIIVAYAREIIRLTEEKQETFFLGQFTKLVKDELPQLYSQKISYINSAFAEIGYNTTGGDSNTQQEEPKPENEERLTQMNVRSECDVIEAMWCSIRNVSEKTFPILSAKYKLQELILANLEQMKKYQAEIAEIMYPGTNVRIGEKRAKSIVLIGYNGIRETLITKRNVAWVKLLSQIPGVSEETAKIVLDNFCLKSICRGQVSPEEISELKRENNRRIGKVADSILKFMGPPGPNNSSSKN